MTVEPSVDDGSKSFWDGCECNSSKKASSLSGVRGIMSTKGPHTTSVGGGKEQVGLGEGGGAGMSFLEDLSDGAANLTGRFFLSRFGGLAFFFGASSATSSSSASCAASKQEMPKHSIIAVPCRSWRGDGVGLQIGLPSQTAMETGSWLSLPALLPDSCLPLSQADLAGSSPSKFGEHPYDRASVDRYAGQIGRYEHPSYASLPP